MKRDQLKSLLLGAILLAGITLPAKAQIGEQRHNFAIGINGGANYSTVSFQPTIKQNGLLGITGGVTARYISEKYSAMICGAQLELNFSQRGWDEKFDPEQVLGKPRIGHPMNNTVNGLKISLITEL